MVAGITIGAKDHLLIIIGDIHLLDVLLTYSKVLVVLFQFIHAKHVFVKRHPQELLMVILPVLDWCVLIG